MRISDWSSDVCPSDLLARVIDAHPFADPLRFRHASGEMIAFRVVPHGPECMRDTRELVLARPTRWRCSPDLESERGGHSAAQPDLLPHPVRIVAVRAACRGIERVNRSEEHTSELQSLMRTSYAVFCLKKKINTIQVSHTIKTYNKQ